MRSSDPTPGGDEVIVRPGTVTDAGTAAAPSCDPNRRRLPFAPRTPLPRPPVPANCPLAGSFLLVAERGTTTVGFVAGATDVRALYKQFLLRDGVIASATSALQLLRAWPRALETLRHGASPGGETPERSPNCSPSQSILSPAARESETFWSTDVRT